MARRSSRTTRPTRTSATITRSSLRRAEQCSPTSRGQTAESAPAASSPRRRIAGRRDARSTTDSGSAARCSAGHACGRLSSRVGGYSVPMSYLTVNPATGETLQEFDEITDSALEIAVAQAAACFQTWRDSSFAQRATNVAEAASLMESRVDELARLATLEMGKLYAEAQGEVMLSVSILRYYATNAERFLVTEQLDVSDGTARVESSPLGILFGVQPWNFPYYQLARFVAPNVMAGNVVMVKHAGSVPQCALAFEALWQEVGAPPGLYTNLFASYDQVNSIIDDPRIKGVALTGSSGAGRSVAARAGQNLKKSTMELGGSDPFIVLADANIDKTLKWAMVAKMNNTGQSCVAGKRFIVDATHADSFLEQFAAAMSSLQAGDPMDATTTLGPLSSEAALETLEAQVDKSVAAGATVVIGGKRLDRAGSFFAPTILTDITPDNPAYHEEFFGPVALFFTAADDDEAVRLANDSDFGLGCSIFTEDEQHGERLASRVESGMVFINHPTWTAAEIPFGGIKTSGYGRELSPAGIHEFVNKKLVRVLPIDAPA